MAMALGRVDEADRAALEALCRAAEEEMAARLRTGVGPEDCAGAFTLGCAWLALAGLAAGAAVGVEQFTAGSVTVREAGGADARERAAALRLQAETVLAPYLGDRGFVFRGVEG